jgi:hypothetical protein
MDDRILFDRFHEALDVEPRPGAFERMRSELLNQPVALQRRPAFRMRFSKMGLRIAAAIATAAILIAVVAALLATHHSPTGSVPAAPDKNVTAYQSLNRSDYATFASSTSSHCTTIQDTGCAAAVIPVEATLQRWVSDLSSFRTPTQYLAIDGMLRRHLTQAIADLNAAVAFQKASNESGFNFAMNSALYERAWIDPTTYAIEGSYPRVAGSFRDAINIAKQSLDACVRGTPAPADLGCAHLTAPEDCSGSAAQTCNSDVQAASAQAQMFLIALVQNPSPRALASKAVQLEGYLAQADTALLSIAGALLTADQAKVQSGLSDYTSAINGADSEVSAIATS